MVPPLIVEPDVSVNIPVIVQIVNNPPPIQYEVCINKYVGAMSVHKYFIILFPILDFTQWYI